MELVKERVQARPRYSRAIEPLPLQLPAGKALGPAIAAKRAPNGELFILHHGAVMPGDSGDYLPHVVRFTPDLAFIEAWGGPDHVPAVEHLAQRPVRPHRHADAHLRDRFPGRQPDLALGLGGHRLLDPLLGLLVDFHGQSLC